VLPRPVPTVDALTQEARQISLISATPASLPEEHSSTAYDDDGTDQGIERTSRWLKEVDFRSRRWKKETVALRDVPWWFDECVSASHLGPN